MKEKKSLLFCFHKFVLKVLTIFNIEQLSKKSADFSGAEIYQAIIEGMHIAFNENREFTTNDILHGLTEIIPLAQLEGKKIQALQTMGIIRANSNGILYSLKLYEITIPTCKIFSKPPIRSCFITYHSKF